eukprot:TRINITY_DN41619_c0_g1_i1.p1 TRINITY_DN41619_c0_g1~~TRINITY_DN41619_c0_g1_i1.p1  ORF type:complete len:110 (-),score=23.34 TRINITY_DN41619_c0_g1_i1:2-331(-)
MAYEVLRLQVTMWMAKQSLVNALIMHSKYRRVSRLQVCPSMPYTASSSAALLMRNVKVTTSNMGETKSCSAVLAAATLRPKPLRSAMVLMLLAVGMADTIKAGAQKANG